MPGSANNGQTRPVDPPAYRNWTLPEPGATVAGEVSVPASRRWKRIVAVAFLALPLLALVGAGLLIAAVYWQARDDERAPSGAIVVLGAAQFNGIPSQVLQARLDEALALYQAGYAPVIVVTGGNMPGDAFTEGGSSFNYLVEQGVPPEAILVESASSNTEGNISGATDLLKPLGITDVLIVSDGFHLMRGQMIARDNGLNPRGVPATNSPIEPGSGKEFSYVMREVGAIVKYQWQEWF